MAQTQTKPTTDPATVDGKPEALQDPFPALVSAIDALAKFHKEDQLRHPPRMRQHVDAFLKSAGEFVTSARAVMGARKGD